MIERLFTYSFRDCSNRFDWGHFDAKRGPDVTCIEKVRKYNMYNDRIPQCSRWIPGVDNYSNGPNTWNSLSQLPILQLGYLLFR